jgi:hypothetical protein
MKTTKIPKTTSKKLTSKKPASKKPANQKPARQIASAMARVPMKYALPGGMALGACLLAATGILFRNPLKAVVRSAARAAMHEGIAAIKLLEGRRLLAALGARRRGPSIAAIAGTGLGTLGAMAAGSALTVWLAPNRTMPSLGHSNGAMPKSMNDSVEAAIAGSDL